MMIFKPRSGRAAAALACVLALGGGPAQAQLLPSSGLGQAGLPLPIAPLADRVTSGLDQAVERLGPEALTPTALTPKALAAARLDRLAALVRAHPRALELDDQGQPAVRGEVLALSPTPDALARIQAAGFTVARQAPVDALGLTLVTLTPPKGLSAVAAVKRLRQIDPAGDYDFNHVYADAGTAGAAGAPSVAGDHGAARAGLLDGAVAVDPPVLRGVSLRQRGFAPGGGKPSAHGTAVASLLAAGGVRELWAADVYGQGVGGGSASAIVAALAWMAEVKVPVINVSLVGPANGPLGAAIRALVARGVLIVAAVGNDGPAAPPLYPASYPGVIAVTGVDRRRNLLPEAGRATHVDFAAYGAGVKVAAPGGRAVTARGTSYAAPVVAARLAGLLAAPDPAAARRAVSRLSASAIDLGAPGPDAQFGAGLVVASP